MDKYREGGLESKRLCTCLLELGSVTPLVYYSCHVQSPKSNPIVNRLNSEQIYHPQIVRLSCIGDIRLRRSKGKSSLILSIKWLECLASNWLIRPVLIE